MTNVGFPMGNRDIGMHLRGMQPWVTVLHLTSFDMGHTGVGVGFVSLILNGIGHRVSSIFVLPSLLCHLAQRI